MTLTLRESSTDTVIGVARLPLETLIREQTEQTYCFEQTPLLPPARAPLPSDEPIGTLTAALITDWGLSNQTAGDFHNSSFEFARRRRAASSDAVPSASAAAGGLAASLPLPTALARAPSAADALRPSAATAAAAAAAAPAAAPAATAAPPPAPPARGSGRVPRDRVILSRLVSAKPTAAAAARAADTPSAAEVAAASTANFVFDHKRYTEYERVKATLKPDLKLERTTRLL